MAGSKTSSRLPLPEAPVRQDKVTILPSRGSLSHLIAEGEIPAPWEQVWSAVTDYAHYHEFMPRACQHVVLPAQDAKPGEDVRLVRAELDFKLRRVRYTMRLTHDRASRRIAWTMTEGDVRANQGQWAFEDLGARRCLLRYELEIDPGLPIPGFIRDRIIAYDLGGVVPAVRQRIVSRSKA